MQLLFRKILNDFQLDVRIHLRVRVRVCVYACVCVRVCICLRVPVHVPAPVYAHPLSGRARTSIGTLHELV